MNWLIQLQNIGSTHFTGNEEIIPLNCSILNLGLKCLSNLSLIGVNQCTVKVPISCINCILDSLLYLPRLTLKTYWKLFLNITNFKLNNYTRLSVEPKHKTFTMIHMISSIKTNIVSVINMIKNVKKNKKTQYWKNQNTCNTWQHGH